MASYIPRQLDGPVLELGPGTGAVTKEILHRVPREKLICLEYSTDFCNHLRVNFAGLKVVQGDAYNMDKAIPGLRSESLSAIVSSLPLVTRPPKERLKCLELAFDLLKPGAPFIQFSYSLASPVPLDMEGMKWQRSGWILQNIPPARVWVYRKP
ncbi:methyltransferase domain-containing protein [Rhodobacteraceae bacterium RKSG542]|nr:methyltransferase domain-containing protein [Pseudovibrio flavus]